MKLNHKLNTIHGLTIARATFIKHPLHFTYSLTWQKFSPIRQSGAPVKMVTVSKIFLNFSQFLSFFHVNVVASAVLLLLSVRESCFCFCLTKSSSFFRLQHHGRLWRAHSRRERVHKRPRVRHLPSPHQRVHPRVRAEKDGWPGSLQGEKPFKDASDARSQHVLFINLLIVDWNL